MSKNYNDCDIVLELLPLYIEQKTGAESNAFVGTHLTGCKECQEVYRFMSEDLLKQMETAPVQNSADNNVPVLSKQSTRKPRRIHLTPTAKRVLLLLLGLVGYACLMVGVVVYTFLYLTGA